MHIETHLMEQRKMPWAYNAIWLRWQYNLSKKKFAMNIETKKVLSSNKSWALTEEKTNIMLIIINEIK